MKAMPMCPIDVRRAGASRHSPFVGSPTAPSRTRRASAINVLHGSFRALDEQLRAAVCPGDVFHIKGNLGGAVRSTGPGLRLTLAPGLGNDVNMDYASKTDGTLRGRNGDRSEPFV